MLEFLRRYPKLRSWLKFGALNVGYLFSFFRPGIVNYYNADVQRIVLGESETFFGYYDVAPDNGVGLLLMNVITNTDEFALAVVNVGEYGQGQTVAQIPVSVMNLQIGLRAQWLNDSLFLFNDIDSDTGRVCVRIIEAQSFKEVNRWNGFLFSVIDADKIVCVNLERIFDHDPDYSFGALASDPSVSLLSIRNLAGEVMHEIFLSDLGGDAPSSCINHTRVAPDKKNLVFIQRSLVSGRRSDRLWLLNLETYDLNPVTGWGEVSHLCFIGDLSLLVFMKGADSIASFQCVDLVAKSATKADFICQGRDGHPSILGDLIISDTYPDLYGYQNLYLGSVAKKNMKAFLKIKHPPKFRGAMRCDLHPRFSFCGRYIYFDSVHAGVRSLYRTTISGFENEHV